METSNAQFYLFDSNLNSNQKESKILKGILKPRNSFQKNNQNRRISWGGIRQRNFVKNDETFFDNDSKEERKKIPEIGLSSSPFVLKQDESFFFNVIENNLENLDETRENNENNNILKEIPDNAKNNSYTNDIFLRISLEESERNIKSKENLSIFDKTLNKEISGNNQSLKENMEIFNIKNNFQSQIENLSIFNKPENMPSNVNPSSLIDGKMLINFDKLPINDNKLFFSLNEDNIALKDDNMNSKVIDNKLPAINNILPLKENKTINDDKYSLFKENPQILNENQSNFTTIQLPNKENEEIETKNEQILINNKDNDFSIFHNQDDSFEKKFNINDFLKTCKIIKPNPQIIEEKPQISTKRRLSDAIKTLKLSEPKENLQESEDSSQIPPLIQNLIESMRLENDNSENDLNFNKMQENIEKIASAKKFKKIDEDLEFIYKSTDYRTSNQNKEYLCISGNNNENDFSPATIKYIENQSNKVDINNNLSESQSIHKMSLSPGSLLDEPYLEEIEKEESQEKNEEMKKMEEKFEKNEKNDKNGKNEEKPEKSYKNEEKYIENSNFSEETDKIIENNEEIDHFTINSKENYRKRLTEFGLKNILSVIEENSSEKNDDSTSVATWKKKDYDKSIISSENKENFNENSKIIEKSPEMILNEVILDGSFGKKKSVNFQEDSNGSVSSNSQSRKKYKKTPIINRFQKRNYQDFEGNLANNEDYRCNEGKKLKFEEKSIFLPDFIEILEKKEKKPDKEKINKKQENELNSPKIIKEAYKTTNLQIIQESPLSIPQKNRLVEILSSNCKKSHNNMNLLMSIMNNNYKCTPKDSIEIMALLKCLFKEKAGIGKKTSNSVFEKKQELSKIQVKINDFHKKMLENKERIEKIKMNITEKNKIKEKIEVLRNYNSKCVSVAGLKINDIEESGRSYRLKCNIASIDSINYHIDIQNRTISNITSQNPLIFNDNQKISFLLENMKLIDAMILKRIKKDGELNKFKSDFEIVNKISFYYNSISLLMKSLEKIQKESYIYKIAINVENTNIELIIKFFNNENKYIKYEINIFEWFNEIRMSFDGSEEFPEKLSNVLNTIYNSEITKMGIHKIEKILEKTMALKLRKKI